MPAEVVVVGPRELVEQAAAQRQLANRVARLSMLVAWPVAFAVLAWQLARADVGSPEIRIGALAVFATGLLVAAFLAARRFTGDQLVARIDEVSGDTDASAVVLRCSTSAGVVVASRTAASRGSLAPGRWTVLVTTRSGQLEPLRVSQAVAARLGLPVVQAASTTADPGSEIGSPR